MDWQQSGKGRRERRCRASISGPMKPHAPSAYQGAPYQRGSLLASSAFAVLVARYFSPLQTFKRRLTATVSRPLASRNCAVSRSRPARSPRRCQPLAVSRQRANTGCNVSHLSRPYCSQPLSARALVPIPAPLEAGSSAPLHSLALFHSRPPEARSPGGEREKVFRSDLTHGKFVAKNIPKSAFPCANWQK